MKVERGDSNVDVVRMLPSAIAGIEATSARTSRSFARHFHEQFGIGRLLRGGQRSLSGIGVVEALQGDMITVNPGEVHDGEPLGDAGRSWSMLYFDPSLVFSLADELRSPLRNGLEFSRPVIKDARLDAHFDSLFAATVGKLSPGDGLASESSLCTLLEYLIRHHTSNGVPLQPVGPVARAKQRIDDDPAQNLTLAELASEAGLTRFQLLRSFARELGLPPHAYLLQRRTALARTLIVSGRRLADAAAEAGFADQSHMNRAFMRFYGYTSSRFAAVKS